MKFEMRYERPIALSIAGFDPTGGAGILADANTFAQCGVLGMGILSANTVQTEDHFISVDWVEFARIKAQLEPIFDQYEIKTVKIGIIENQEVLKELCSLVKSEQPNCKIVWDPVIASSSGTILHNSINADVLKETLPMVSLVTPNVDEARILANNPDEIEAAFSLGEFCPVLLKGGHSLVRLGLDLLIENRIPTEIVGGEEKVYPKHGSGCILSAAITANLALGKSLNESCRAGKKYIEERLMSNSNLLAYHVK